MTQPSTADIRAWARTTGLPIAAAGRLPRTVLDAYAAAHPDAEAPMPVAPTPPTPVAPTPTPPVPGAVPVGGQGQWAPYGPQWGVPVLAVDGLPWGAPRPAPRPRDRVAVAALLGGLLSVLGIPLAVWALLRLRRNRLAGRAMAVVGLLCGLAWLGLTAVAVPLLQDGGGVRDVAAVVTGTKDALDLEVGDCLDDLSDDDEIETVDVGPCVRTHEAEVIARFELGDQGFPGDQQLEMLADDGCDRRYRRLLPQDGVDYGLFAVWPSEDSWSSGDRSVLCLVTGPDGGPLERPLSEAGRGVARDS